MFELVCGREATIERCAVIGGLVKVVVLEVGRKGGTQATGPSSLCFTSVFTGARNGALALKSWVSLRIQLFAEC